mgnify:FL=1
MNQISAIQKETIYYTKPNPETCNKHISGFFKLIAYQKENEHRYIVLSLMILLVLLLS